jgi:hypothetical protein
MFISLYLQYFNFKIQCCQILCGRYVRTYMLFKALKQASWMDGWMMSTYYYM